MEARWLAFCAEITQYNGKFLSSKHEIIEKRIQIERRKKKLLLATLSDCLLLSAFMSLNTSLLLKACFLIAGLEL